MDSRHVTHAAGASSLSPAGLDGPAVVAGLGCWVSASGASLLLDVVRGTPAPTAQCVRLVVALAKRAGSFRLEGEWSHQLHALKISGNPEKIRDNDLFHHN